MMFCDTCVNRSVKGWCRVQELDVHLDNYCPKYQSPVQRTIKGVDA